MELLQGSQVPFAALLSLFACLWNQRAFLHHTQRALFPYPSQGHWSSGQDASFFWQCLESDHPNPPEEVKCGNSPLAHTSHALLPGEIGSDPGPTTTKHSYEVSCSCPHASIQVPARQKGHQLAAVGRLTYYDRTSRRM